MMKEEEGFGILMRRKGVGLERPSETERGEGKKE